MKKRKLAIAGAVTLALLVVAGVAAWILLPRGLLGFDDTTAAEGAIPRPASSAGPLTEGDADWPSWRGPARDGTSPLTGIRKDWSGGLRKLWEVDYLCHGSPTQTWSAPAVRGNRLVVPGRDLERDHVFCLDPGTGELLWHASYEAPAVDSHGPGARATPSIDGDRVYTFGRSGDLACWRLEDGSPVWRRNVRDSGGKEPRWGYASSPFVHGARVIVQAGGTAGTIAYDKMTGEVAWRSTARPASYATVAAAEFPVGETLVVFHGSGLAGLDPRDGTSIWETPWRTRYGVNATTPVASGPVVFITSGYGTGCEAVDVGGGEPRVMWRNKAVASQHSDPVVSGGFVYGYSGQSYQNRGRLKCVELATGTERWSTREAGWGTLVLVDGHLLCLDIKGNLHLARPDPDGFVKVAEFPGALTGAKNPCWTPPVVANGRLFLRYRQRLVCYDLVNE